MARESLKRLPRAAPLTGRRKARAPLPAVMARRQIIAPGPAVKRLRPCREAARLLARVPLPAGMVLSRVFVAALRVMARPRRPAIVAARRLPGLAMARPLSSNAGERRRKVLVLRPAAMVRRREAPRLRDVPVRVRVDLARLAAARVRADVRDSALPEAVPDAAARPRNYWSAARKLSKSRRCTSSPCRCPIRTFTRPSAKSWI